MKYGKVIEGNLIVKKGCKDDFSNVVKITGYCDIYSDVELPKLENIGGSCYIHSDVELPKLENIGGYCDIYSDVEFKAPKLENIGGSCYIYSDVEFKAPKLENIGGYCYIYSDVELPKLENIGGYCYIYSDVEFKASKKLKKNNPETAAYCAQFTFNNFFKLGFLFADNILAKLLSKRTNKNGTNVYKIQLVGQTKISYCIEVNGVFSHGGTIKEAKASLLYKISDRDTSKYDNYTLDTIITFEDAVKMYRCITGACEAGTRHFVESVLKNKKKKYTVREVIEETKGQYNNEVLAEFFNYKENEE